MYHANVNVNSIAKNVTRIKIGKTINACVSVKNQKKHYACKKGYIWISATCTCENGKYLGSIIENLVITCNEIIEESKTVPTNINDRKLSCQTKISIFYLPFYLLLEHYWWLSVFTFT